MALSNKILFEITFKITYSSFLLNCHAEVQKHYATEMCHARLRWCEIQLCHNFVKSDSAA